MDDRIETGAGHLCVPPLLLAALAVAIAAVPGAGAALQFEPGRMLTALTGHLTHWNHSHLLWDTLALGALGILCCYFSPSRFWIAVVTSAIAIPIAIVICQPELSSYRGLSGIDSALLGLALVEFARHARRRRKPILLLVTYTTGICFGLKLLFEYLSGNALFVSAGEADFVNVPLAHLIGFGCGAVAAFAPQWRRRPTDLVHEKDLIRAISLRRNASGRHKPTPMANPRGDCPRETCL